MPVFYVKHQDVRGNSVERPIVAMTEADAIDIRNGELFLDEDHGFTVTVRRATTPQTAFIAAEKRMGRA